MRRTVYIGGGGRIAALSVSDGSLLWERELKPGWFKTGNDFVSIIEEEERLIAFSYGKLFILRKSDGEILMAGEEVPRFKNVAVTFPDSSRHGAAAIAIARKDDGDAVASATGGGT